MFRSELPGASYKPCPERRYPTPRTGPVLGQFSAADVVERSTANFGGHPTTMKKSQWKLLFSFFAIVALFALVAAACGDDDDSSDPTAADPDPTATTEPVDDKFGGEITVHNVEFQHFDPHKSNFSQDLAHENMVFRGLYKISAEGLPVPEMAASMPTISADGLTYTIKLQDGLVWSDGDDLTAADFVAGLQRTCSYEILSPYQ